MQSYHYQTDGLGRVIGHPRYPASDIGEPDHGLTRGDLLAAYRSSSGMPVWPICQCGEPGKRPNSLYCSIECRREAEYKRERAKRAPREKKRRQMERYHARGLTSHGVPYKKPKNGQKIFGNFSE